MDVIAGVSQIQQEGVTHYFQLRLIQPEFLYNAVVMLTKHLEYHNIPLGRCVWSCYPSVWDTCTLFVTFNLPDIDLIGMVMK